MRWTRLSTSCRRTQTKTINQCLTFNILIMDKFLHFIVCAALSATFGTLAMLCGGNFGAGAIAAIGTGLGTGLGKEFGDAAAADNHWDWLDVAADAAGVALGVAWCAMFYFCKG